MLPIYDCKFLAVPLYYVCLFFCVLSQCFAAGYHVECHNNFSQAHEQQVSTMIKPVEYHSDYRQSHLKKGADYDQDLASGDFNTYMAHREDELLRRFVPGLFPAKIPRYLDFACGTGRITSVMEQMAETSIGLDVSESMVAEARKRCQSTEFVLGDITSQSIDLEPVNCVTAFRFFGNAQDNLRTAVLEKLSPLVVKGGYLIINNHRNPKSLHEWLLRLKGDTPETDLDHKKLHQLLAEHQFKVVKTIGVGLWVCTHSLRAAPYQSGLRHLEFLSTLPGLGSLCPDAIIVAKRT